MPIKRIVIFLLMMIGVYACANGQTSAQTAPAQPVSAPPDVEVLSIKWVVTEFKTPASTTPAAPSETIAREGRDRDPMPVVVPNPNIPGKPTEHRFYSYYVEILNRGAKDIKAVKLSYILSDKETHTELKRFLGFGAATIRHSEKKSVRFWSPSSPPWVINANSSGAASPYGERVVIECVVYADRSLWINPQAKPGLCDNLRDYKPR
ncbi:MAG TPA: hypothetical protein VE961_09780 [Pyrinomonadaceae bacterium]|nr:hypothetical protein [Pyrinomonadaceae bacterium]